MQKSRSVWSLNDGKVYGVKLSQTHIHSDRGMSAVVDETQQAKVTQLEEELESMREKQVKLQLQLAERDQGEFTELERLKAQVKELHDELETVRDKEINLRVELDRR